MRVNKEEKLNKINALIKSGLTVNKACQKAGVAAPNYYNWRKKETAQTNKPAKQQKADLVFKIVKKRINTKKELKILVNDFIKNVIELLGQ